MVRLSGLDKVQKRLSDLLDALKRIKESSDPVQYLKGKASPYPSPFRTGLDRTGELGRSWEADKGELRNVVGYAQFVVGEKQTRFHAAHGWKNVIDVLKAESRYIFETFFEKPIHDVLK